MRNTIIPLILVMIIVSTSGCVKPDTPQMVVSNYYERLCAGDFLGANELCVGKALEMTKAGEGTVVAKGNSLGISVSSNWEDVYPKLILETTEQTSNIAKIVVSINGEVIDTLILSVVDGEWKIKEAIISSASLSRIKYALDTQPK